MNLSMKWLNDYVPVEGMAPRAYCEGMTMSGSKVEGYEIEGAEIQNVVVGQVTAMERHPDSDHLWVCQVNLGDESVQIITGAQNVHIGDYVPVAAQGRDLLSSQDYWLENPPAFAPTVLPRRRFPFRLHLPGTWKK